jgi:hypothetical protein
MTRTLNAVLDASLGRYRSASLSLASLGQSLRSRGGVHEQSVARKVSTTSSDEALATAVDQEEHGADLGEEADGN